MMPVGQMQPRAQHYVHTVAPTVWKGYQYIAWICGQWEEFARENGVSQQYASVRLRAEFDAWLAARCPCNQTREEGDNA